ncbi:MAG: osmoprotectant NAGGN system M42 family peptidase [Desulfamplus sp.]|nr:osmoprotectant NAGGN system M42 family peptidase [Desulfamplus sp.]
MFNLDEEYLSSQLLSMLNIPSPAGYTDQIVHYVCAELEKMGIHHEVTRRGAIRATIPGTQSLHDRAICVHLDTLGGMVSRLKSNGRLALSPVGTWSSRFAEGARVTVYTSGMQYRGTVMPLKASGHVFGQEVDSQPVDWDHVEVRVDLDCSSKDDLIAKGFDIGDFISFDANPEIVPNGYINSRHLDNKAGTAILLSVARYITDNKISIPVDCHLLFTIFEEVGIGATEVLYSDINEMIVIDCAMVSEHQNSSEHAVTIAMMDQAGPFDYHLNKKLARLCRENGISFKKDLFKFYRSDSASAIESGSDTRTALIGFGIDGSHGYERTHMESLRQTAKIIYCYMQSDPTFSRDQHDIGPLKGFPHQPVRDLIQIET